MSPKQAATPYPRWSTLLLCIAAIGFILRVGAASYLDFWHDELFSLDVANQTFTEFRDFVQSGADYHPPGFHSSLQAASALGAENELLFRLINLLWYLILMAGLWAYARAIPRSQKPLLWVAATLAVGPSFVYHSTELRMYSMLLATSTLGLLAGHLAARSLHFRWFAYFGLASLAGALTHYSSVLVSLSIGVAIVLSTKQRMRALQGCIAAASITGVSLLPFLGMLSAHMAKKPIHGTPLWRSCVYIGAGVTLPLLLAAIAYAIFRRQTHVSKQPPRSLGQFALTAALLFLGLFLSVRVLLSMNLVNSGVALVPASWLVVAAAYWLSSWKLLSSTWIACMVLCNLPLTAHLLYDPSTLAGNRLSTITKFRHFTDAHSTWSGPNKAIVHIDWPRDNRYFRQKLAGGTASHPLVFLSAGKPAKVSNAVRQLMKGGAEEVLILTRSRLKPSMLTGLEADFSVQHQARGVAIVRAKPHSPDS